MRPVLAAMLVTLALPAAAGSQAPPSCPMPGLHISDPVANSANFNRTVRIRATGLEPGKPVFMHVRANQRFLLTRRIVPTTGACGDFSLRIHLFRGRAFHRAVGYRLSFDNRRVASVKTRPQALEDYVRRLAIPVIGYREKLIGPSFGRFLTR